LIPTQRARRQKLLVLSVVAAVVLTMWALAAVSITNARRGVISDAGNDAGNLSAAFAEEINYVVRDIDGAMSVVIGKVVEHRGNFNLYDMADQINLMSAFPIQASLIGPDGWLRSSTLERHPTPIDLSDREHFRVPADPAFKGIFISKPVTGRVSKQVTLQFTRRIESKDGKFLGVLVFSVPPKALTKLPKSINIGPHDFIGLVGLDNVVRARFSSASPDGLSGIGLTMTDHPTPAETPETGDNVIIRQSGFDHVTHIISNRRIPDYPLVVGVGFDLKDRLAEANSHARMMLFLVGAATLLLGVLVAYLMSEIDRRSANDSALALQQRKLEDANFSLLASKDRAEQAETLLYDAINCISEAFVIFDKDDCFVLCNDAYRRLYPQSIQYMLPGKSFTGMLHHSVATGEHKDAIGREEEWMADRLRQHQQANGVFEQALPDGRHIMTLERRMKSGGIAGLRIDVTNLVETKERLEKALDKAEAASQAKSMFLANMSHELRTPLNAIIGFSQLIKNQNLGPIQPPAYVDYAAHIASAGDHLLELISNILDISRIEAGKADFKEEPVDTGELVQGAMMAVRVQAEKKSLTLAQCLPESSIMLHADPLRLRQILINLLGNAVKFTPNNGRVAVSFDMTETGPVFIVTDTGIGMTPREIALATQPFEQIDNALVKRYEGVGLGLSLAKHLTEMHGGRLEIESAKGAGTTVRVCLPAERILDTREASAAA